MKDERTTIEMVLQLKVFHLVCALPKTCTSILFKCLWKVLKK